MCACIVRVYACNKLLRPLPFLIMWMHGPCRYLISDKSKVDIGYKWQGTNYATLDGLFHLFNLPKALYSLTTFLMTLSLSYKAVEQYV